MWPSLDFKQSTANHCLAQLLTIADHLCLNHFRSLFSLYTALPIPFFTYFDFGVHFPIWGSQVTQLCPSLILFGFIYVKSTHSRALSRHRLVSIFLRPLVQLSSDHNNHSLVTSQPFLGPCSHLHTFIRCCCPLSPLAFCSIHSTLCLANSIFDSVIHGHL